jgi:hypothetical protein
MVYIHIRLQTKVITYVNCADDRRQSVHPEHKTINTTKREKQGREKVHACFRWFYIDPVQSLAVAFAAWWTTSRRLITFSCAVWRTSCTSLVYPNWRGRSYANLACGCMHMHLSMHVETKHSFAVSLNRSFAYICLSASHAWRLRQQIKSACTSGSACKSNACV